MDRSLLSKVTPQQRNIAIAVVVFLFVVHLLSPSPNPSNLFSPPIRLPSVAAGAYWATELDTDASVQDFLAQLHSERATSRNSTTAAAFARGARRNDRTLGSRTPVTVYWPEPPYFWDKFYGAGKGERIDVKGCKVECSLISGKSKDPAQRDAHVLLNYNTYRATIDGLPEDGPRTLEPWQKSAVYSMEPNTFAAWHQSRLKVATVEDWISMYPTDLPVYSCSTLSPRSRSTPTFASRPTLASSAPLVQARTASAWPNSMTRRTFSGILGRKRTPGEVVAPPLLPTEAFR